LLTETRFIGETEKTTTEWGPQISKYRTKAIKQYTTDCKK